MSILSLNFEINTSAALRAIESEPGQPNGEGGCQALSLTVPEAAPPTPKDRQSLKPQIT